MSGGIPRAQHTQGPAGTAGVPLAAPPDQRGPAQTETATPRRVHAPPELAEVNGNLNFLPFL